MARALQMDAVPSRFDMFPFRLKLNKSFPTFARLVRGDFTPLWKPHDMKQSAFIEAK
jgi:hypothetical protein